MRIALITLFTCFSVVGIAQNLVPNPSFESTVTPPCSWLTAPSQLPAAVTNWTMPSSGSTDIFSNYVSTTCYAHNFSTNGSAMGQQAPHTGNVQSALVTYGSGCGPDYREYLQVQLTSPMASGQVYDVAFWISMADYSYLATNNFGMYFSTGSVFVSTCSNLSLSPQFNSTAVVTDKIGWVQISGSITATANWSYVIIGNFFNNAATSTVNVGGSLVNARYYIDDISVRLSVLDINEYLNLSAKRLETGTVALNWSPIAPRPAAGLKLQRSQDGDNWETIADLDGATQMWEDRFARNAESFYRLRYTNEIGEDLRSNHVQVAPVDGLAYRVYLSNNPATGHQSSRIRIANADATPARLSVHDLGGREVWSSATLPIAEMDNLAIPSDGWRPGIYLVTLQTADSQIHLKLVLE